MWIEIKYDCVNQACLSVTPLAGVWIEIEMNVANILEDLVTPLAGVWIEITELKKAQLRCMSLPLRECGLKY